ncbi:MAG: GTPase ObgE [Bacteroidetes bacterium]|nr:GTPase ObgE [Bacteroidota bacterium]MDA1119097.1 GTPase ObgE [Bacteroidota bacterium]
MASSNFIDYVNIFCRSGAGGSGSAHFRREKFVPKGGPDGGDGGRGGHIILRGNKQLWTLIHLKYRKHIHADSGKPGEGGCRSGAHGDDIILDVPLGTIAKDAESGKVMAEVLDEAQEVILINGGRGGLGNYNFKTATNQSPRHAQLGDPTTEAWVILELKLLADVGLVGFPNAGKSTLLSVMSEAKPEIADYPFTTLTPNLGVVAYRDHMSFVMADIPGIIEGASQGKGLGIRFLRHIERNSILLYMIASDSKDIRAEYNTLKKELKRYNPELLDKASLLAISKSDLLDQELMDEIKKELPSGIKFVFISSVMQQGLLDLKDLIWKALN